MDPKKIAVEEVMSRFVSTLDPGMSVREAMACLKEQGVSGAPVLDERGECVGVFSVTDLARCGTCGEEAGAAASRYEFDPLTGSFYVTADEDLAELEKHTVGEWMSRDPKSVGLRTSVEAAAKVMARAGIHRVLVTEDGEVRGILTSLDIVRLVAGFARAEQPVPPSYE